MIEKGDTMIKLVDSTCKGCIYLGTLSGGKVGTKFCDYIGFEDKPRPCPAGKGCTVRKEAAKKKPYTPYQI